MRPDDPLYRYHRQLILPQVGEAGQARLSGAHVLIVGVGALGAPASDLLARAGVGRLTLVDRDVVEPTNLQRQTLYCEEDARRGRPKALAARDRLVSVNSGISIEAVADDFSPRTAEPIALDGPLGSPDLIVDGADSFETRLLINDLAAKHGIPYLYAGVVGTRGAACVIVPGRTPCLRCLIGDDPDPGQVETCDTAGVLGPAASMLASIQAANAIRLLVEADAASALIEIDAWTGESRRIRIPESPDPACPCCVGRQFRMLEGDAGPDVTTLCGRHAVQIEPRATITHDLDALLRRLAPHGDFEIAEGVIRGSFRSEWGEAGDAIGVTVFEDGRSIVSGSEDPARARGVYARYIGL